MRGRLFTSRNDPLLVRAEDGCPLPLRVRGRIESDAVTSPTRPGVVLLAGGDGAMSWWRALLPEAIADEDERAVFAPLAATPPLTAWCTVVACDARGSGWAGRAGGVNAPPVSAADALRIGGAVFDAPFHLVGHGLGGLAALEAALSAAQSVASVTLIGTPLGDDGVDGPALVARDEQAVRRMFSASFPLAHPNLFGRVLAERRRARLWDETLGLRAAEERMRALSVVDVAPRLGALDAPVLVVHGTDDGVVPMAHAREAARLLPHGSLREVDGGHALPLEGARPLAALLREHIAGPG
jgi:pimeloyl-ACP methyl ester carboxylesterase